MWLYASIRRSLEQANRLAWLVLCVHSTSIPRSIHFEVSASIVLANNYRSLCLSLCAICRPKVNHYSVILLLLVVLPVGKSEMIALQSDPSPM